MSIIYSYPEQGQLNPGDMLIGTSVEKVGGKQKNVTKNFTIQQVADFVNSGVGLIDPVATDFQIPVFNQGGLKITGSIMSQNAFPNGSIITISGGLTATDAITTSGNLIGTGNVTLGSNENLISLNSKTRLNGPLLDTTGTIGSLNQILLSDSTGVVRWQDYEAGLTYEGTWDASNNTTNGESNSPALLNGQGTSGHFYIVNVPGSVNLDGNNEWHVGDWAVFLDQGSQAASWQKIDNTSTLVGSGTAKNIAMWTNATTLNDSLLSQDSSDTKVMIDGLLEIKGDGTSQDGRIKLNCWNNNHGVTIQSPPHSAAQSWTWILPQTVGGANDVLTTDGNTPSQLSWTTPTVGTVTGTGTENYVTKWSAGGTGIEDSTIFDNGTNVGIGTTNPSEKLHVDGNIKVTGARYISSEYDSNNYMRIEGNSSGGVLKGTDGGVQTTLIRTYGDSYLNGGYVGIGTTSPGYRFTAYGSSNNSEIVASFGSSNDQSEYTAIGLSGFISSNGANKAGLALKRTSLYGAGELHFLNNNTADNSDITLSDSKMMIDSSGNVGIGTTSPAAKLEVDKGSEGEYLRIGGDNANNARSLRFTSSTVNGSSGALHTIKANSIAGEIAFANGDGNIMYLKDGGNVGIGTDSPSAKLHVEGISNVGIASAYATAIIESGDAQLDITSGPGGTWGSSLNLVEGGGAINTDMWSIVRKTSSNDSDLLFNFGTNNDFLYNNTKVTFKSDGNVGIGTDSPAAPLVVSNGGAAGIELHPEITTDTNSIAHYDRAASAYMNSKVDALTHQFLTSGTERARIDSSGNVGIGTVSPGEKLTVSGNSNITGKLAIGSTGAHPTYDFYNQNSSYFNGAVTLDSTFTQTGGGNSSFSGNVGIGNSSPAVSLDISGTDAVQMPSGTTTERGNITSPANGMLRYNSTNNGFEGYINGNWGDIGGGSSGGLIFRGTFNASTGAIAAGGNLTSGATRVAIAIGDMYIVDTAGDFYGDISKPLNVGDEVICVLDAAVGTSDVNDWNAIASGSGGAVTGSGTTNYVPKFTGATVVGNSSIFNDASGKVGIGTTSPAEKLDVAADSANQTLLRLSHPTNPLSAGFNIGFNTDGTVDNNVISLGVQYSSTNYDVINIQRSTRNVGIGTTSPSALLHLASSFPEIRLEDNSYSTNHYSSIDGNGGSGFLTLSADSSNTAANSAMLFKVDATEAMRINSAGNVGIGTDSPSAKLDVQGDGADIFLQSNDFKIARIQPRGTGADLDKGLFSLFDGSTENVRIDTAGSSWINGGNVGIGTSSPTRHQSSTETVLHIANSNVASLNLDSTAASGDCYVLSSRSDGSFGIYNDDTNNTPFVINSTGNVGIGTASPAAKLDIQNGIGGAAASIVAAGTSAGIYLQDNSAPTDNYFVSKVHNPGNDTAIGGIKFAVSPDASNYSWAGIKGLTSTNANAGNLAFYTSASNTSGDSSTERMRIDTNGNVGIGTDQPEVSLDLGSNNDAILVPNGDTAARPSGILPGMIRYNTETSEFEGYSGTLNVSGSWGALGGSGGGLPTKTVVNLTISTATPTLDLTVVPSSTAYVDLYVDGVYQNKNTFTVNISGILTLNTGNFPSGSSVEAVTTT